MDADEREKMLNIMFALNQWIVGEPFADKDGRLSRSWANFWERWYSPSDDPNRFITKKVFSGGKVDPTYQVENPKYSPLNSRSGYQKIAWPIESFMPGEFMPDWFYLLDHPSWGKVLIVSVLIDAERIRASRNWNDGDYPLMVWFYDNDPTRQQQVQVWSEDDYHMNMLKNESMREWLMEGKLYMITDWLAITDQTLLNWMQVPETLLEK